MANEFKTKNPALSMSARLIGSAFAYAAAKRVGVEIKLCHFNKIRVVISGKGEILRAECWYDVTHEELANCICNLVDRIIEQNTAIEEL